MSKTISMIPVREWSKRLPGKNRMKLHGKELFRYTVDASLNSSIDTTILTTDDQQIISIAKEIYSSEIKSKDLIIIDRPKELASDTSTTNSVITHVIDSLWIEWEDILVLLQATTPLRAEDDINRALEKFINNSSSNVISMKKVNEPWTIQFTLDKNNNKVVPLLGWDYILWKKESKWETYIPNWAIYISTVNNYTKHWSLYNNQIIPFIMSEYSSIDIDVIEEFQYCEYILSNNLL